MAFCPGRRMLFRCLLSCWSLGRKEGVGQASGVTLFFGSNAHSCRVALPLASPLPGFRREGWAGELEWETLVHPCQRNLPFLCLWEIGGGGLAQLSLALFLFPLESLCQRCSPPPPHTFPRTPWCP